MSRDDNITLNNKIYIQKTNKTHLKVSEACLCLPWQFHTEKVTEMREFLRFISEEPFLLSDLKKGTKKVANPPNEKLLQKVSRQTMANFC